MKKIVAILETMWGPRAGTAPRYFRISEKNHSGKRLYKLVDGKGRLLVTNSCRELVTSANKHGTPDPAWLAENLKKLDSSGAGSFDLLLVCGKVAQATYEACAYVPQCAPVLYMPHPAARATWDAQTLNTTRGAIAQLLAAAVPARCDTAIREYRSPEDTSP